MDQRRIFKQNMHSVDWRTSSECQAECEALDVLELETISGWLRISVTFSCYRYQVAFELTQTQNLSCEEIWQDSSHGRIG